MRNHIVGLSILALAIGCGGVKKPEPTPGPNPPPAPGPGPAPAPVTVLAEILLGEQMKNVPYDYAVDKANQYMQIQLRVDPLDAEAPMKIEAAGLRIFTATKEDKDKKKGPTEAGKDEETAKFVKGSLSEAKFQIEIGRDKEKLSVPLKLDGNKLLIEKTPIEGKEVFLDALSFNLTPESAMQDDFKLESGKNLASHPPVFVVKADAKIGDSGPQEADLEAGLVIDPAKPGVIGTVWSKEMKPEASAISPAKQGCYVVALIQPTDTKIEKYPLSIDSIPANGAIDISKAADKKVVEGIAKLPAGKGDAEIWCVSHYSDAKITSGGDKKLPILAQAFTVTKIKGGITVKDAAKKE